MKRILVAVTAAILAFTSLPGIAQHREGHDRGRHEGFERGAPPGHWRDREIHRFHERDIDVWRGGRWYHGYHDNRLGWWWIAAGLWYFYPAPVYPYPDPYAPPVVVNPPVVVVPQAPAPAPIQPQPQYWYYCASARGYYPYVPNCPEPWQPVPAQPQTAPR